MTARKQMSFEMQSEARVWIDLAGADEHYPSPLKLTISQVASLYTICDGVLRKYSEHATQVLSVLPDAGAEA